MKLEEWLAIRTAQVSEQLREEALSLNLIDTTQEILCRPSVVLTAPVQKRIEELKREFGYTDVIVYPEGLSVAEIEVDGGSVSRPRRDKKYFHITSEGKPAYEQRYWAAQPFVNGHAVVTCQNAGIDHPRVQKHIYPDGEPVYPYKHTFLFLSPFSKEGIAKATVVTGNGLRECNIDLSGNIVEI